MADGGPSGQNRGVANSELLYLRDAYLRDFTETVIDVDAEAGPTITSTSPSSRISSERSALFVSPPSSVGASSTFPFRTPPAALISSTAR